MSSRRILKGDLIKFAHDGMFDIIVHGCNCFRLWPKNQGMADQVRRNFEGAYKVDMATKRGEWLRYVRLMRTYYFAL